MSVPFVALQEESNGSARAPVIVADKTLLCPANAAVALGDVVVSVNGTAVEGAIGLAGLPAILERLEGKGQFTMTLRRGKPTPHPSASFRAPHGAHMLRKTEVTKVAEIEDGAEESTESWPGE